MRKPPQLLPLMMVSLLTLTGVAALSGCDVIAYAGSRFEGDPKPRDVAAQYTDLADKKIAVMVLTDDVTRYHFPEAALNISLTMSRALAQHVPGVTTVDPEAIVKFQRDNPYWSTVPPSRLLRQFDVQRLIVIDVAEYSTHEPGNKHLWRGVIDAAVAVYQAEDADPDNKAFEQRVRAEFPENSTVGLTQGDPKTIQLGVLKGFTFRAAGLFYDHQEE